MRGRRFAEVREGTPGFSRRRERDTGLGDARGLSTQAVATRAFEPPCAPPVCPDSSPRGRHMDAHACTWTHMHAHGRTCRHTDAYACIRMSMQARACTCMHMDAHTCTWMHIRAHAYSSPRGRHAQHGAPPAPQTAHGALCRWPPPGSRQRFQRRRCTAHGSREE